MSYEGRKAKILGIQDNDLVLIRYAGQDPEIQNRPPLFDIVVLADGERFWATPEMIARTN